MIFSCLSLEFASHYYIASNLKMLKYSLRKSSFKILLIFNNIKLTSWNISVTNRNKTLLGDLLHIKIFLSIDLNTAIFKLTVTFRCRIDIFLIHRARRNTASTRNAGFTGQTGRSRERRTGITYRREGSCRSKWMKFKWVAHEWNRVRSFRFTRAHIIRSLTLAWATGRDLKWSQPTGCKSAPGNLSDFPSTHMAIPFFVLFKNGKNLR